jgi:DNA end-binding protein Ku
MMASTVWRGYITFGLISIPVRLFRAARAERVPLRRLHRAEPPERTALHIAEPSVSRIGAVRRTEAIREEIGSERGRSFSPPVIQPQNLAPVQQVSVREGTDEVLPETSVVKGYEFEKGRFVALEPEELKSAAAKTSTEMAIEEFVRLAEIDPVFFETSYYVMPEEAGEKAYALLYRSMQLTGLVAVAQFAMHAREHVVVLRPGRKGMLAHTMFFTSEVRADEEFRADTSAVAPKELELAQTLIGSLAAEFQPEKYRDNYRQRLESMIANKVKGEPVARTETVARSAPVVDIAEALRRSLANLKKPPAAEEQSPKSREAAAPRAKKTSRSAAKS